MGNPIDDHLRPFCIAIQEHMAKAPGPAWDDTDDEQWRQIIGILKPLVMKGIKISQGNGMGWSAEGWQILFFIRNNKFRPTWDEVKAKIRQTWKIDDTSNLTGEEAKIRKIVTAPEPPVMLESAGPQQLGIPEWLDEFPSKDNGGVFDRILLQPLMHLPDHKAREAIRIIKKSNDEHEKEKLFADATERDKMKRRKKSTDRLSEACRYLKGQSDGS